jgi:hypothetical protein
VTANIFSRAAQTSGMDADEMPMVVSIGTQLREVVGFARTQVWNGERLVWVLELVTGHGPDLSPLRIDGLRTDIVQPG